MTNYSWRHHFTGRAGWGDAEASYRQVLARDPNDANALRLLGRLCLETGRIAQSLQLLRRAVAAAPDLAPFRADLAGVLGAAGHHGDAAEQFAAAVRLDPSLVEAWHNLGVARERAADPTQAEAAYRRAIELRPDHPEAHNHLGNVLRKQGRLIDAAAAHREAIRLRPAYAQAFNNLSATLAEAGLGAEARACDREAARLEPDSPTAGSTLLFNLHYDPS